MPGDREKCLQAGMDDYLSKPLEKSQLIEVLAKYLTQRALVVDGDPSSQNVLVRTLIESGWQVILAETRRSATYEASLAHFDLIVLDVSTPHLESMKVVKLIRQLEEYSGWRARIIGVGDGQQTTELQARGFDGVMERPLSKSSIKKHLKELTTTKTCCP
jgi:CheY-like chemotaxis protein